MLIRDKPKNKPMGIDDQDADTAQALSAKPDTLRLVLGILAAITGLFKLLSVVQGDVPVIGDLIPALCGFAAGFVLIFEYYRQTAPAEADSHVLLNLFLDQNKRRIGFLALGSAGLHFLFPQALFI